MKTNAYRRGARTVLVPWLFCFWSCSNDTATRRREETSDTSTSDAVASTTTEGATHSSSTKPGSSSTTATSSTTGPVSGTSTTETLPSSAPQGTTNTDSDTAAIEESSSSGTPSNEDAGADGSSTDPSSTRDTSGDVESTRFAFIVSTNGIVRALRMEPGAEPTQVADFDIGVTFGDFFINANELATRVFVSYNQTVMALEFDPAAPAFTELDTATTAGGGTYVELSPDGEHVIVAHYNEGKATHVSFDGAQFGAPSESSPGQNAHSARVHPSGNWAYVPCLGSNHVAQYTVGEALIPSTPTSVSVPGGPRHMTFHPDGKVAYVLTELSGQAYAFAVASDGTLAPEPLDVEEVASGVDQPSGSDVQVTPDGKHLYAFIRRNQNLYHFDIATDGVLSASGEPVNFGQEVRAFTISPTGDVLLGGGSAGILYTYAIDAATGSLTAVGDGLTDLQSIQATVIRDVSL